MRSCFTPVGQWPQGCWHEKTGALQMRMAVDVIEGGWYWRPLGMKLHGMPLPVWLFPRAHAYKRIENGQYLFDVDFSVPLLGRILRYHGLLQLTAHRKN